MTRKITIDTKHNTPRDMPVRRILVTRSRNRIDDTLDGLETAFDGDAYEDIQADLRAVLEHRSRYGSE